MVADINYELGNLCLRNDIPPSNLYLFYQSGLEYNHEWMGSKINNLGLKEPQCTILLQLGTKVDAAG